MSEKPKLPERGFEGIPTIIREQIRAMKKCSRHGCFAMGRWTPILLIRLIGQTEERETVKLPIPVLLCDKCKETCAASDILQEKTWDSLTLAIQQSRKKPPNRDTLSFDWRDVGPKLPLPKLT